MRTTMDKRTFGLMVAVWCVLVGCVSFCKADDRTPATLQTAHAECAGTVAAGEFRPAGRCVVSLDECADGTLRIGASQATVMGCGAYQGVLVSVAF
jgi:hypothetical protein